MKGEEVDNSDPTNAISDHASEPNIIPTTKNVEVLDFPISSTDVSNINDSLYDSLSTPEDKNKENTLFTNGLILHAPSVSLASDLQVEFSEIGSPTLTTDESHEDLWGENEVSEQDDILEADNWSDIGSSSISLQNNDEENAAHVSFMSPTTDILDDSPTYAMSSDHNIHGNVRQTTGVSQYSSDVLGRWKRLMRLMDTHVEHLPQERLSENLEVSRFGDTIVVEIELYNQTFCEFILEIHGLYVFINHTLNTIVCIFELW